MDRALCQKRLAMYSANCSVFLHVLGGFLAIGAIVGPFLELTVAPYQCPGFPYPLLPGGILTFYPSTWDMQNGIGPSVKNTKYGDNAIIWTGYINENGPTPPTITFQLSNTPCLTQFPAQRAPDGPDGTGGGFLPPPPNPCLALVNAGSLGNTAVACLAIGLILSLTAGTLVALRACRLRNSLPGSGSSDKSFATRATFTISLSAIALALYVAAYLIVDYTLFTYPNGLAVWFANNLYWPKMECIPPNSLSLGAGCFCMWITIGCAFVALALDFVSHCCCKSNRSDGCCSNPNYWWVLPNPETRGPGGAEKEVATLSPMLPALARARAAEAEAAGTAKAAEQGQELEQQQQPAPAAGLLENDASQEGTAS